MVTTMLLLLTTVTKVTLTLTVTHCNPASLASKPFPTVNVEPNSMMSSPAVADVASVQTASLLTSDLEGHRCIRG